MEAELERFRRKKRAEERSEAVKERLTGVWRDVTGRLCRTLLPEPPPATPPEEEEEEEPCPPVEEEGESGRLWVAVRGLQFAVWLLVYVGFIKIGFGAVFFTLSALVFIWRNTGRGGGRGKGRGQSAYSVFNPNCEAIDGSLKAEHLERQLLYRH